jgi:hypothetical protein
MELATTVLVSDIEVVFIVIYAMIYPSFAACWWL